MAAPLFVRSSLFQRERVFRASFVAADISTATTMAGAAQRPASLPACAATGAGQ